MPALKPTRYTGKVVWLGRVSGQEQNLRSAPLADAHLGFAGIDGEVHGGLTRPACSRTQAQYPKGTEIRNVRQLTILSREELTQIAHEMGLAEIDPIWLGASMVIEGIPDFSHVPPSSRLQVSSGASLTVDMENRPCVFPAREIGKDHPESGSGFISAAQNRRGITAWVEREGAVTLGDDLRLHVPDQPVWKHLEDARQ